MVKLIQKTALLLIALMALNCLFLRGTEFYEKKLIVIAPEANVHLDPSSTSPVIDVLKRGSILYLAADRPFRKVWKYIYYTPGYSSITKAGYILADKVRALFKVTKVYTIHGGQPQPVIMQEQKGHFRRILWGMSPEEVVALEGEPLYEEEKEEVRRLDFASTFGGIHGLLSYYFVNDQLVAAQFAVRTLPSKKTTWMSLYSVLKEVLDHDFGQAQEEGNISALQRKSFSGLKGLPQNLCLESKWESEETQVLLRFIRDGQDVSLEIRAQGRPELGLAQKELASLLFEQGKF